MAMRLEKAGLGVYCSERLDDMLLFWETFCELNEELSHSLMADVRSFAESVTRMYDPQLQVKPDDVCLHARFVSRSHDSVARFV